MKYPLCYELDNPDDLKKISSLLMAAGIHLETDLFGQFYIVLDKHALIQMKEDKKNV